MGRKKNQKEEKNMSEKIFCLAITGVVGFVFGCTSTVMFLGGSEDKMLYYRSVLIKHGVAEYRADENGEPMFVIKAEPIKP